MSQITFTGPTSGTGTVNISAPVTNTERNLTLPDMSGTITAASSGTADATTFLRGDGTWAAVSSAPTTTQVLDATAGASLGAVGTYAMLTPSENTSYTEGSTAAGSGLRYTGAVRDDAGDEMAAQTGSTPAGTWRAMGRLVDTGQFTANNYISTLWLRIS